MAKCEICGREMTTADGCSVSKVFMEEGERCHDCGALVGHYHHWGCDAERCPACHEQLIGCACDIYLEEME